MEILSTSNYERVATTTNHTITFSVEKGGKSYDVLAHISIYHPNGRKPLVTQSRILNYSQSQLWLTEEEEKTITEFAEKSLLAEVKNEVLVNVGEIARTMQSDFGFEVKGDEEEWDNYTNAAMDSLEQVYGFETKLTAALKQQNAMRLLEK